MVYRLMLAARQHPRVELALSRWRRLRGEPATRSEAEWLSEFAVPGQSFVDIGGMWGIDGEVAVRAAELGCAPVTLVDFFTTEPFEEKLRARGVDVRFVQGSGDDPRNVELLGKVDRVWCWGVLYHHPAPGQLLAALRMITGDRLLLESRTIPNVPGVRQAAVFWPYLPRKDARRWSQRRHGGVVQMGIDTDYEPNAAGANDFWGMTPATIIALARTYGLECVRHARSPKGLQRHVFEFRPVPIADLFGFGPQA